MKTMKCRPLLLLLALVPAPSLGVLSGMILFPDSVFAKVFFVATKIWMFSLPVVWWWFYWRRREAEVAVRGKHGNGIMMSVWVGIAILVVIVAAYALLGDKFIDKPFFVAKIREAGFGDKHVFLALTAYWICVNSLLEEVVWRWFVTGRFAEFTRPAVAVVLSGLCFTLHHILAMSVFFPPLTNAIASAGVFVGGVLFSWLYFRYKSIWPPYIAHVFADIAVFGIGYWMLSR